MVKYFKIGKIEFKYVFKHRFEKDREKELFSSVWRKWELGIWGKTHQAVAKKHHKVVSDWGKNSVNVYMIGIELLWCRMWLEFSKELLRIGIDD